MNPVVPVALIGTGFAASIYIEALRHVPGLGLVCVAGRDVVKAAVLAKSAGVRYFTDDVDSVLRSRDIAAVILAVPPFAQSFLAIEAFRNGKHVLCEKPLAATCVDAEQVFAAWKDAQRIGMVNFCYRLIPEIAELKRWIYDGGCGDLHSLQIEWILSSRLNRSLTHHWKNQKEQGGGVLQNYGTHVMDYLFHDWAGVSVLGATKSVYIRTRPDANGHEKSATGDEVTTVLFNVNNSVSVVMHLSLVTIPAVGHRIVARGNAGTLEVYNSDPRSPAGPFFIRKTDSRSGERPESSTKGEAYDVTMPALFARVLSVFLESVHKQRQVGPSIEDGVKIARLVDAIDRIAV